MHGLNGRTTPGNPPTPRAEPAGGIVELVLERASATPGVAALVPAEAPFRAVTYGALAGRIAAYAAGLRAAGVRPGSRVLLLARPDAELYAFALAVLARGMALVLVDGRRPPLQLAAAIADAAPDVVVAPPAVLAAWPLVPALRRARRITTGRGFLPGALRLERLGRAIANPSSFRPLRVAPFTPAIISFSSGTTGRAKAIVRTHGVLVAQHRALAAAFPMETREVNLPGFPAVTLHNLCCGATTVLPAGDLRAMADADPRALLDLLERCRVTSVSGSPALMTRLAEAALARGRAPRTLRRLVVGGGPVGRALCRTLREAFPAATGHVVYGATEAEPVATCTLAEVERETEGAGFLVGRPVRGLELLLVDRDGRRGVTGEVTLRGAHVASNGGLHRTGDVARVDDRGRLWLLGRAGDEVVHRGRTLQPYAVEAAALAEPGVRAAALVAHRAAPEGELVVSVERGYPAETCLADVRDALACLGLATLPVRRLDAIPLDARHASKVSRAALVRRLERWA